MELPNRNGWSPDSVRLTTRSYLTHGRTWAIPYNNRPFKDLIKNLVFHQIIWKIQENMVFWIFKNCDNGGILPIHSKKNTKCSKNSFFTKKVCFRDLCLCRFHVFQKVKKVLLHLTAQRKTSKIMKIIYFLQRFSLEISIISKFWILLNSIKSLWYSTNKFSIFRKLLKKLLLVAFSIRKSIITNVAFSYNYHKTPLIAHWKLTIIMWNMNLFGLYSVVNHW